MEAEVTRGDPWILTLELDAGAQAYFDGLRKRHYPAELNRIVAHLTLFHKLPAAGWVQEAVARVSERDEFAMRVAGVRSLGRGVAFGVESAELVGIHAGLATEFAAELSAQDRQKFWPHVVVQNKVSGEAARALKGELEVEFEEFSVRAVGLELWWYRGGPWELEERFPFSGLAGEPGLGHRG